MRNTFRESSCRALNDTPLSSVSPGSLVFFGKACGGCGFTARLAALGLVPGAPIEVCRNDGRGPLLVRVKDSRIMLGRGMAEKLLVCYRFGCPGRMMRHIATTAFAPSLAPVQAARTGA